jgi:hypothetical protein
MNIRWLLLISLTLLITIIGFAQLRSSYKTETGQTNDQHIDWIRNSLSKIQTIQVGMTRGQLLEVFTTEGGLSTGLQRTYVFRECPYIKVDVKFSAVGRSERDAEGRVTLEESSLDIIKEISRPYLQWTVAD